MSARKIMVILALLAGTLGGCAKYRPSPLNPTEIVGQVDAQRENPTAQPAAADTPASPFTFVQAAGWLRQYGPEIQEALAAYRTSLARAQVKTPLPNPALEIGPQFGFGPDIGSVNRTSPFGSIGFTIPLGKRLRRQDELNRALTEVARVEATARHRELYLELRQQYTEFMVGQLLLDARQKIQKAAEQSVLAARKLVQAGQGTAIDVALFELEEVQSRTGELNARIELSNVEASLSQLIGVRASNFKSADPSALPTLPDSLPPLDSLKTKLIHSQTELARLRARYEAAERGLRLEIAKQVPDFQFGPSFSNETGEKKTVVGLTLGIELPFFDRNGQGIAEATKTREAVRIQYESAANRALAILEHQYKTLSLAQEKTKLLRENLLPRAEKNIALARQSLEAGVSDAIRLLEADRGFRSLQIEAVEADLALRQNWVRLEKAVGHPLLSFPGEPDKWTDLEPGDGTDGAKKAMIENQQDDSREAPKP